MKLPKLSVLTSVAALSVAAVAFAADTEPEAPASADKLAAARAQIAQGNWSAAITELRRVNDTASADWNNLLAYSYRKAKTPDMERAERYYGEALRIDPKHRGALEYSGEMYLTLGNLPRAEAQLATLSRVCAASCREYTDLKKSIDSFKVKGKVVGMGY